ncbi:hypothetical protein PCASD_01905 [Puccinia coronata f. sp. avenae]|uniref:Uncharacterized protein n=1 Tax=Puccinia coronata f. sp. avenae TaxID=200324 RepID=A0A2N5VJN4_9BASI|nr:hypothetical protein PCASD_23769 [Puccinia coronata f. sp. avenae]PLW50197.1 hypothetical protein PCASD_01905 [Puccinia coronata f. sp. avenae]
MLQESLATGTTYRVNSAEDNPPNRESGIASGTASGSALPLPSKTRRSRHKYSSRSRPSID